MKIKFTLLLLVFTTISFSQVKGKVSTLTNKPLSFVSVYIDGTITGTTTNNNGDYELMIQNKGEHTIIYQILGYKTVKKTVTITSFPFVLNIKLAEEQVSLDEVLISSKENPATKIIRNVIANKRKNTNKFTKYKADFYSRGLFKVKNLPEKFFGEEVGDMGGGLDSTRSGVVYLSETISKISFQKKPSNFKEHIIASKVSGKEKGISFNEAKEVDFNFYKNSFKLDNAQMISPIANDAFSYYKYKLVGTFYDKNGRLISKIQLLPKRKSTPVFSGFIYIVEDDWAIYGTDVITTGTQVSLPAIDTLHIKQNYNYSTTNDVWVPVTQTIDFKVGLFGFNFNGRFSAVYSNYDFNPNFDDDYFSNEVISFAQNATEKDSLYWNKIRPVSLTLEEKSDYKLKDSIKTIRSSKKYLDSIDAKENTFKFTNLLSGYSYRNTLKKWNISVSSPFENINFNTVQGWNSHITLNYDKRLNEKGKRFSIGTKLNYGLSDKKLRPTGSFTYKWNDISNPILNISGGITTPQFNENQPISPFWNTLSSVLFKRNYLKIYEKTFAKISFGKEITNGVHISSGLEYAKRKPLVNTTNYSMFSNKGVKYTSNNPLNLTDYNPSFTAHKIWSFTLQTKINFGQKYISYPNRKYNLPTSKYPSLLIGYRKNFNASKSAWNSDLLYSQLTHTISLDNWGEFNYNAKGGMFLKKKELLFMDYIHFNGNRLITDTKDNYLNDFFMLPYYEMSTNNRYGELHGEYNFKGAILSKIPLLNELNFHLVTSAKGLFTNAKKPYSEFAIGLDNVGFGKWRFLRVDYARSYFNGKTENRVLVGFKIKL